MCNKADLPYWKYIDSKSFLILAEEEGRIFAAWENPNESISSFENIEGNYPSATFVHHPDMTTFIKTIAWHDWIKEGILDEELAKLVENK